ncbi:1443_t:CDS:2 [Funneliformis geosporum]|nr:1443_t:CDS:2 [Funneliformis geosporum]
MSSGQYYKKDAFFVDSNENIKIEVLHYPLTNIISNYPPILFIHGLYITAWAWDNYCRWFSNKGYDCYAMSLWTLNDITNDVSVVTDAIITKTGDKPILVGHSLGGAVLQNYLKYNQQKVAGGVLFATLSPYSYKKDAFKQTRKSLSNTPILPILKALITLKPYALIGTPELLKKASFSKAFPDSMAKYIHPKLDKVSFINVLFEIYKPFVDPTKIKCPIIVIGAEEDKLFDFKVIKETAEAYGVGFDIIEGAGHNITLDLTWEDAARIIFNRIQEKIVKE